MSSTETMEEHALAILGQDDLWDLPLTRRIQASGEQSGAVTPKFLYYLIKESQRFGGSVLDQFWKQLGTCDEKLKENIESLGAEDFVSAQRSYEALFQGLDPEDVDFRPVLAMAEEFFTHLGVGLLNPGGRKSGTSTGYSISEALKEKRDRLSQRTREKEGTGKRQQVALKALAFQRDGESCRLTHKRFSPYNEAGPNPDLAYIIPHAVGNKPKTLDCIAMFAGNDARNEVEAQLNEIGNVMNLQHDAHASYDAFRWGIEAVEGGGEVKYFFRMIQSHTNPNPLIPDPITLKDGEEIRFGKGPEGKELNNGPIPRLCNLQLAVARILKMSAAADIILQWKDDADDDGCDDLFIASEEDVDMLDAKLLLSGRAVVA